jgi:hypothetical protein
MYCAREATRLGCGDQRNCCLSFLRIMERWEENQVGFTSSKRQLTFGTLQQSNRGEIKLSNSERQVRSTVNTEGSFGLAVLLT